MTGWERGEEWGQCRRVWGSLLDGKTRGTVALVVGGVSVVIDKVEVGWDVGGGLGAKAE